MRVTIITLCALLLSGMLLAAAAPPPTVVRAAAERRWQARAPAGYRLVVQVQQGDSICLQHLHVRDGEVRDSLLDTCSPSWLTRLHVDRLFELSRRVEEPPDCFGGLGCLCQRVRVGRATFDPAYGFPRSIEWRREYRPNWRNAGFWLSLATAGRVPGCGITPRQVRITVLAFIPETPGRQS
jgi:hypothetical protein